MGYNYIIYFKLGNMNFTDNSAILENNVEIFQYIIDKDIKPVFMSTSGKYLNDKIFILITGHRGYIGAALNESLTSMKGVKKIVGYDILDYNNLVTVMRKNRINLVIHLAALSSVTACNKNPNLAIRINAIGTLNILNAMKETNCYHIIYASTAAVYGKSSSFPYTEDMHLNPSSIYGISKLLGEYTLYNHFDLKKNPGGYLIFRIFDVIGTSGFPIIDHHSVNNNLLTNLESGNITIYGNNYSTYDGTYERDYVALKDVCKAYMCAIRGMMYIHKIRAIVNICSEDPVSLLSIIDSWNHVRYNILIKNPIFIKQRKIEFIFNKL